MKHVTANIKGQLQKLLINSRADIIQLPPERAVARTNKSICPHDAA